MFNRQLSVQSPCLSETFESPGISNCPIASFVTPAAGQCLSGILSRTSIEDDHRMTFVFQFEYLRLSLRIHFDAVL
jgi:hypothetical protein